MVKRDDLIKANFVSDVNFAIKKFLPEQTGSSNFGMEFFPMSSLDYKPVLIGKDLEIYAEHARLKGTINIIISDCDKNRVKEFFHPMANAIRFIFDDRASGNEEFSFIEFNNIDLIDIEDPAYDEKNISWFFKIRFILSGFNEHNKFICMSAEMTNWFKSFGVSFNGI